MSRRSIRRKDKVYSSPVFLIIIGVLAALLSIPFLSGASDWPAEAVPADSLNYLDLKSGTAVCIEDAVLLDRYGYTTKDGKTTSSQCAVAFEMADGEWVITSLEVPHSSDLYQVMLDYLNDETQQIGDCRFPMCAEVASLSIEFKNYLYEYVTEVFGQLNEYHVISRKLTMRADTAENYAAAAKKTARNNRLIGAGILALGLALIGAGVNGAIKRRAQKRETAAGMQEAFTEENGNTEDNGNTEGSDGNP